MSATAMLLLSFLSVLALSPEPPTRIIVLGDSITKGVRSGVTAEETFGALLQRDLLAAGRTVEVLNQGIGGERTD
ncbi:MAG: SGNH/GDSL hydrolase family protein, partial [Planctomycetaceae bacterium]